MGGEENDKAGLGEPHQRVLCPVQEGVETTAGELPSRLRLLYPGIELRLAVSGWK